jgi:hypothetical protein
LAIIDPDHKSNGATLRSLESLIADAPLEKEWQSAQSVDFVKCGESSVAAIW